MYASTAWTISTITISPSTSEMPPVLNAKSAAGSVDNITPTTGM